MLASLGRAEGVVGAEGRVETLVDVGVGAGIPPPVFEQSLHQLLAARRHGARPPRTLPRGPLQLLRATISTKNSTHAS